MKDKLFEKAYERILSEFQIVMDLSLEDTQKKLDKALKRNLESQVKPATPTAKLAAPEVTSSEQTTETDDQITG